MVTTREQEFTVTTDDEGRIISLLENDIIETNLGSSKRIPTQEIRGKGVFIEAKNNKTITKFLGRGTKEIFLVWDSKKKIRIGLTYSLNEAKEMIEDEN